MKQVLWLGVALAVIGCGGGRSEDGASGSAANAVVVPADAAVAAVKPRRVPPIEIEDVSAVVFHDADREGVFTGLEVQFTARAKVAVDSTDAQISIWGDCPLPDRWGSISGNTWIRAMAESEARRMRIVVINGRAVRRVPAFCGLKFVYRAYPRDPVITLAELHWDGTQIVSGPPPNLARELPGGPPARVQIVSATRAPWTLPAIGGPVTGPYYLSVRYRVTPLRTLDGSLRIVGVCNFADGTQRQDSTTSLADLARGELVRSSGLFMPGHLDELPTRCELVFELHRSRTTAEPFPELIARVEVEPTEADLRWADRKNWPGLREP